MLTSNKIIHQNHRRREAGDTQVGKLVGGVGWGVVGTVRFCRIYFKTTNPSTHQLCTMTNTFAGGKVAETKQQKGDIALQLLMPVWMTWNELFVFQKNKGDHRATKVGNFTRFIIIARKRSCEGYVFTGVCLSTGGLSAPLHAGIHTPPLPSGPEADTPQDQRQTP